MQAFVPQQPALAGQAARIASQRAAGGNDPVTGRDYGQGIGMIGHAHGAKGTRAAYGAGNVCIAACPSVGNAPQGLPDLTLKGGAAFFQRQAE